MKPVYRRAVVILSAAMLGPWSAAAHAVEWQINQDTTFSVYGSIELIYLNERQKINQAPGGEPPEVAGVRQLQDRDTTLGFAGQHQISENLTGYFRAEFEYAGDEASGDVDGGDGGIAETDEIFVGVKGPWGRAQVGTWDGIYEDFITDKVDVFEYEGLSEFESFRTGEVGDAVAYFSPSFGGFSFAVQGFFKGRGEGRNFDQSDPEPDSAQAFQAVIGYTTRNLAIHLGYDDNGLNDNAGETLGLGLSLDLQPFTLSLKYEHFGENPDRNRGEISAYAVAGSYDYGKGSITLAVQQVEPAGDGRDSRTELGVNIDYHLAENFYIYAEHLSYGREHDLGDYTGVGFVYAF